MENLGVPIEIFLSIIKLLSTKQLLVCKAVCKKWNSIISGEFRFKKLVLSTTSHFNERWYLSYEFVCPSDLIQINDFNRPHLDQPHFLQLKSLFLYSQANSFPPFNHNAFSIGNLVNRLKKLEQLELNGLQSNAIGDCIALESLKTLYIGQCNWRDLCIKCPNLINLKMKNDDYCNIKFEYPLSVRSLEITRLRSDWVEEFSNLEKLSLYWIYWTRDRFLSELPNLKQYVFNGEPNSTYEVLIRMKRELNRSDLKLFPSGFLFDTETLPANYYEDVCFGATRESVSFIKEHLSRFVVIDQIYTDAFPFNLFADCFIEGIPEALLKRLVHVKSFEVNAKVNDVGEIMKVLDILGRGLNRIKIESSSLDQTIFDCLPKWCPVLDELSIREENELDLAFILKFKSLKSVQLLQQLNEEFARECFQKYENFRSFCFGEQLNCYKLFRSSIPPFQLEIYETYTLRKSSCLGRNQKRVSLCSDDIIDEFELPTLFD